MSADDKAGIPADHIFQGRKPMADPTKRLIDKSEIQDCMLRCAGGVDRRDWESVGGSFLAGANATESNFSDHSGEKLLLEYAFARTRNFPKACKKIRAAIQDFGNTGFTAVECAARTP
jgi:hypothetical protein